MGLFDFFNKFNQKNIEETKESKTIQKQNLLGNSPEYNWEVSISFRKSKSPNFDIALFLAKKNKRYTETVSDGKVVYQVFFDLDTFSDFEFLFKLTKDWKSTFIMLNNEIISSKTMSPLNNCLSRKVISDYSRFCFGIGAGHHLTNPFGCYNLRIVPSGSAWWWKFGYYDKYNDWIIDKERIRKQIIDKSKIYNRCPYFNLKYALGIVDKLPDKLTPDEDKDTFTFDFDENTIRPKYYDFEKIDNHYIEKGNLR